MTDHSEMEAFFYSRRAILAHLLNQPPEGERALEKRIVNTNVFPPEVQDQYWNKSGKSLTFAGDMVRKVDPRTVKKMIAEGSLVKIREGEYKLSESSLN